MARLESVFVQGLCDADHGDLSRFVSRDRLTSFQESVDLHSAGLFTAVVFGCECVLRAQSVGM